MARSLSEMMRDAHAELRADYWESQFSGEDAKGVLRCMQGINEALASVVDDLNARISALEMQNDTKSIDYRTARLVAPLLGEGGTAMTLKNAVQKLASAGYRVYKTDRSTYMAQIGLRMPILFKAIDTGAVNWFYVVTPNGEFIEYRGVSRAIDASGSYNIERYDEPWEETK